MMWLVSLLLAGPAPFSCPDGTTVKERATPEATEKWCETPDGVREGPRHAFYENGQPWFKGQYVAGKKAGTWQFWYEGGAKMSTQTYKADKKDGPLVRYTESGNKLVEGVCKGGVEEGRWIRYWPNGKRQVELTFEAGKVVGRGAYWSRRGSPEDQRRWLATAARGLQPGSPRYETLSRRGGFGECAEE